jgi:hypothetical protein
VRTALRKLEVMIRETLTATSSRMFMGELCAIKDKAGGRYRIRTYDFHRVKTTRNGRAAKKPKSLQGYGFNRSRIGTF